jgi:hypothetical protein
LARSAPKLYRLKARVLMATCDWFGAGCELPDVVRARGLLAAGRA